MTLIDTVTTKFGARPVPADLLALLALPEGHGAFEKLEMEFLDPTSVPDHSYLTEADLANPGIKANIAATNQVCSYAVFVLTDGNSNDYGYWVHPDETADVPPIIRYDSEGQFSIHAGSLIEALIAEEAWIAEDSVDDEFARLAQVFVDAGVPVAARKHDDLIEPEVVVSPEEMHHRLAG